MTTSLTQPSFIEYSLPFSTRHACSLCINVLQRCPFTVSSPSPFTGTPMSYRSLTSRLVSL
ncbi:hypothetical protein E2C01_005414 [Portunus trituberculatus]|uniref:Uncharacterized protein n=1 Tax=Portunus trituberculatus TaxID=210409 RepID=A0A5B7CTA5_PORTR|nr:hypothetical protein [Portunus trituberculatus]